MHESRVHHYLKYHRESERIGDIDPSYEMLLYLVRRFELNLEQRYWLAWLYAMTYCGASAFYIYNEFPDYQHADANRMRRWWGERGRAEMIVQTDRRWVRSSNMFVPAFESYRALVGQSQVKFFSRYDDCETPEERYDRLYRDVKGLHSFGQFALFLYLEALHTVTPTDLEPTDLDLDKAWSCRNGLYYAYGMDYLVEDKESRILDGAGRVTDSKWRDLLTRLRSPAAPNADETFDGPTVWEIETVLCAYRKWFRGKRYVGYYIDRQGGEIAKMEAKVPVGVCWDVLWQFREETYERTVLAEKYGCMSSKGVDKAWTQSMREKTQRLLKDTTRASHPSA